MSENLVPGLLSLRLLCLQALDRKLEAFNLLMETNPGLGLPFLLGCAESKEAMLELWPRALGILLERVSSSEDVEEPHGGGGRSRLAGSSSSSASGSLSSLAPSLPRHTEYIRAYGQVLSHAAATFGEYPLSTFVVLSLLLLSLLLFSLLLLLLLLLWWWVADLGRQPRPWRWWRRWWWLSFGCISNTSNTGLDYATNHSYPRVLLHVCSCRAE